MCYDMTKQIKEKKAPQKAISPVPINWDNLFSLDVDDDIWQDTPETRMYWAPGQSTGQILGQMNHF